MVSAVGPPPALCMMIKVWPATTMVPDLAALFAATVKLVLPGPLPVAAARVIQLALLLTVQSQPLPVATLIVPEDAAPPNDVLLKATENVQAGASVMVRLKADVY